MTRIFISYSRIDEPFARQLATRLSEVGAQIWLDVQDIPPGANWSNSIQQGLDVCQIMLLIISPESMDSKNVDNEWQYYLDEGKPIVPVMLRPAKVHFQLRRLQYIDFNALPFEEGFKRLQTALNTSLKESGSKPADLLGAQPVSAAAPSPIPTGASSAKSTRSISTPQTRVSPSLLIGLAAVAVLLVAGLLIARNGATTGSGTATIGATSNQLAVAAVTQTPLNNPTVQATASIAATEAVTEAVTIAPIATTVIPPTEIPTEKPTESPTEKPTDQATLNAGNLRIGLPELPTDDLLPKYSPLFTQSLSGALVGSLLQAPLWTYDQANKAEPILLSEIPSVENKGIDPNHTSFTLHLKPDLTWSDGQPITSQDLKFTFDQLKALPSPVFFFFSVRADYFPLAADIDNTVIVDNLTLTIRYPTPQPLEAVWLPALLPQHVIEPQLSGGIAIDQTPEVQNPTVFSGPYLFAPDAPAKKTLQLSKNPNFALESGEPTTIEINYYPDRGAAVAALNANVIDLIPAIPFYDYLTVAKANIDYASVTAILSPSPHLQAVTLNLRNGNPALQDREVRRAIRSAIQRSNLVKTVTGIDLQYPVSESIYAGSQFEDSSIGVEPYDPVFAKQLLDQAGWTMGADGIRTKNSVKLSLKLVSTDSALNQALSDEIAKQLKAVGIDVQVQNVSLLQFTNTFDNNGTLAAGAFDLALHAIINTSTNPALMLNQFSCAYIPAAGSFGENYSGYCDPTMTNLITTLGSYKDTEAGSATLRQIQQLIHDDVPVIILFPYGDLNLIRNGVFNEHPTLGNAEEGAYFYKINNWDMVGITSP